MVDDHLLFHGAILGSAFAAGIALQQARTWWQARQRRRRLRDVLSSLAPRRNPEPIWAKWSPDYADTLRR